MADVKISVGLSDEELKKDLKDLQDEVKHLNKLYRELGKGDDVSSQFETARKKAENLTKQMKIQQEQIERCKESLDKYKKELKNLDKGSDEFKDLSKKIEKTEEALQKTEKAFEITNAQLITTKKNMSDLRDKINGVNKETNDLRETLKNLNFQQIGESIRNAGQSMLDFGRNVVSGFVDALDSSKEFTAELETQEFLLKQLPSNVQSMINDLANMSIDFGFTEFQGKQVATELASFLERQNLTEEVDLTEVFTRAMDLSAMWDLDINDVVDRIQKMMLGNFENSDALGFNMNVKSIEEFLNVDWQKLSYGEQMLASLEYIMKQTEATTGRAKEEAENFASQWNLMKQNITETKNTMLSYIQDAILPYIKKINECITPIKNWMSEHKELTAQIGLGVIAFSGLIAVLGALAIPLGSIVSLFGVWRSFKTSELGIKLIGAFTKLAPTVSLVAVAIGALVSGLIYAYNHSEKFRNAIDKAWNSIKSGVQSAIDFARPYIEKFLSWLPSAWDSATGFLSNVWIGLVEGVVDACGKVKEFMVSFWEKHGGTISEIFNRAWENAIQTFETLKSGIQKAFNGLKSFWNEWGDEISSYFSTGWENVKLIFETAWSGIKTIVSVGVDAVIGVLDVFFKILDGDFEGAWDTIKTTTIRVWDTIKEHLSLALDNISEVIQNTFTWIRDNAPAIWDSFTTFVKEKAVALKDFIVEKFQEIAPKVGEFLKELPGKVYNWLCEVLPKVAEWAKQMGSKAYEYLTGEGGLIQKVGQFLSELPGKVYDWLCEVLPKVGEWASEMGTKAYESLTGEGGFLSRVGDTLKELPQKVFDWLCETLPKVGEWAIEMGTKAYDSMYGESGLIEQIRIALSELPDKFLEWLDETLPSFDTWKTNLSDKAYEVICGGDGLLAKIDEYLGGDGTASGLPATFKKWLDETLTELTDWTLEDLIPEGEDIAEKFIETVDGALEDLPEKFAFWLGESLKEVVDWAVDLWEAGYDAIYGEDGLIDGIVTALKDLPDKIAKWLGLGTDEVDEWKPDLEDSGSNAGKGLTDSVISKITSLLPPGMRGALQLGLNIVDWFKGQGDKKGADSGKSLSTKISDTIKNLLPPGMRAGLELGLKAFDSFKSRGETMGVSSANGIITKITSTIGGLPTKLFTLGAQAGKSLGNGLASVGGWLYNKAKNVWDSFMSGFGKDGGVLTVSQEYETDVRTGQPSTIWSYGKDVFDNLPKFDFDYGKDAIRTISLADFSSPYLSGKSAESQAFTNAFSQVSTYNYANSQSITNNRSMNKNLEDEKKDKEININISIENMNGTEQDINKLMKQIDQYVRLHGKKW